MSIIEGNATRAQAEATGFYFTWADDWTVRSHRSEYGEAYEDAEPATCEVAAIRTPRNSVVDSLGCIDDADDDYRRSIESDMAANVTDVVRAYRYQDVLNTLYRLNDAGREIPPGFSHLAWRLGREINRTMRAHGLA